MAKKIFTYRGKSLEEIQAMGLGEFAELLPARSRRLVKRGFTDAQKKFLLRVDAGENNIKTHCRSMIVLPSMVGKNILIHSGKDFVPILIVAEMIGHYLGEFVMTRRRVSHGAAGVGATRSSSAVSVR